MPLLLKAIIWLQQTDANGFNLNVFHFVNDHILLHHNAFKE